MPAIAEIRRRKFLFALSGLGASALIGACKNPNPEPVLKSTEVPSTATSELPKPSTSTPEPTKLPATATAIPTNTPRRGPLSRVEVPELTPPALRTASAKATGVARPTPEPPTPTPEPPTPTSEPDSNEPLSYFQLWEKAIPLPTSGEALLADTENCYFFHYQTGLVCRRNTDAKELWAWGSKGKLPNNQAVFQPADYNPYSIFAQYLGTLEIAGNRLTAKTYIETIDKRKGDSHGVGWPQPQNGNHQFFYHAGVVERLLLPGGTIETSFEVNDKNLHELWKSPGRLYYANEQEKLAVVRPSGFDRAGRVKVVDLQTGKNPKVLFPEITADDVYISQVFFAGPFMFTSVGENFYKIDLRSGKKEKQNSRLKRSQSVVSVKNLDNVYLSGEKDSSGQFPVIALNKKTGDIAWTRSMPYRPDKILGTYKDLLLVTQGTGKNDTLLALGVGESKVLFRRATSYALAGRALVATVFASNKLWLIDIETGQQTIKEMNGEVEAVVSPGKRIFFIQTGTPKATLTAIKV